MSFSLNLKDLPTVGRKVLVMLGLLKKINALLYLVFPVQINLYIKAWVVLFVFIEKLFNFIFHS